MASSFFGSDGQLTSTGPFRIVRERPMLINVLQRLVARVTKIAAPAREFAEVNTGPPICAAVLVIPQPRTATDTLVVPQVSVDAPSTALPHKMPHAELPIRRDR